MTQLSLDSLLVPPMRLIVALDEPMIDAVVPLMADAIAAVFHAGGGGAHDEPCAGP